MGNHECKGGDGCNLQKARRYADRMNDCRLLDLGSIGPKFTWKGPLKNGVRTYRRLDRGLCNDEWRIQFPEAIVRVLLRVDFSDHHPILVSPFGAHCNHREKPFRFERVWFT